MGFMLPAMVAGGALLGGISGKNKAKNSNKPTRNVVLPPQQLGGWQKLQEIMQSLKSAPQYRPGANNPYLQQGMSHIFNRAGIAPPEGGWMSNPYLSQGAPQAPAQGGITPEMLMKLQALYRGPK